MNLLETIIQNAGLVASAANVPINMPEIEKLKTCKVCKESKCLDNFYSSRTTKDLKGVYCKSCTIEYSANRIKRVKQNPKTSFNFKLNHSQAQLRYQLKKRIIL